MKRRITVGVISDTHGLIRPEALAAMHGADHIVHAGDVGGPEVLAALRAIAPLTAVRGNNDTGAWATGLPETATLSLNGVVIYVLHDLKLLKINPRTSGFAAVIAGHSHRPLQETRDGILYFNPGSAGPRRFKLPVSIGRLRIGGGIAAEIVELSVNAPQLTRSR
jgi:putative phosphoesterase